MGVPKLTDDQLVELVRRYQTGESTRDLGVVFGVAAQTVVNQLRKAGVELRPPGGANFSGTDKPTYTRMVDGVGPVPGIHRVPRSSGAHRRRRDR